MSEPRESDIRRMLSYRCTTNCDLNKDAPTIQAFIDRQAAALRLALEKIGPCVVGWGDDVPAWAEELWSAVNPIQQALGIPETDRAGEPLC